MKNTLNDIKKQLGYDNVIIKEHEWEEIAEVYRNSALQEASEHINKLRIKCTPNTDPLTLKAHNLGIDYSLKIVDVLKTDKL